MIKVTIRDKTGKSVFTCETEDEAKAVIEVVTQLTDVIETKTETKIANGTRHTKFTVLKKELVS